jgi:hypothetical protein
MTPQKIRIVSDGNELLLVEKLLPNAKQKKELIVYKYTKSETKLGLLLPMPPEQLDKMLKDGIAQII